MRSQRVQEPAMVKAPTFGPTSGGATGWSGLVICAVAIASAVGFSHTVGGLRLALCALLAGVLIWCFLLRSRIILVGSSRVDLQACKLEYSIVSPK